MANSSTGIDALVEGKDFGALEERWLETIEANDSDGLPDIHVFIRASDALLAGGLPDRVDVLLDLTVPLYAEKSESPQVLDLMRRWCLAAPEKDDVREGFVKLFRETYGTTSIEAVYLELSNVSGAADPVGAFRAFDRWMRYRDGAFVRHGSGWGTGQIESIDPLMRRVTVNLEKRPHHTMDIEAMGAVLEPLDENHFLALSHQGGERLNEMRDNDPGALVGTVLKSFQNPMALKVIKTHLIPSVIANRDWTKWWARTKKLLRESGFFRVEDKAPYRVERVEVAISYEDDLIAAFTGAVWSKKRQLARKGLKNGGKQHPAFAALVVEDFKRVLEVGPSVEALQAAYVLDRYSVGEHPGEHCLSLLRACEDATGLVLGLSNAEEQRFTVVRLPEVVGEAWHESADRLMLDGLDAARDTVFRLAGGTALEEAVRQRVAGVVENPRPAPRLFVWAVKSAIDDEKSEVVGSFENYATRGFFNRILDLFDNLSLRAERDQDTVARQVLSDLRSLIQHKDKRLFHVLVEAGLGPREARSLYERVIDHSGLGPQLRVELLDILVRAMPEVARPVDVPVWEEDTIYVTPDGLRKREEELRVLMEDTLPEIFEDIGRAAAFGDLSENAEYTSALERRDMFTKRGEQIRSELNDVSLITPEMLKSDEVTLGSKVTLRDVETGKDQVFAILGPWDGGPTEGVISYKSPLGRVFLGTSVGDRVKAELPGGTQEFDVLGIESALDVPPMTD